MKEGSRRCGGFWVSGSFPFSALPVSTREPAWTREGGSGNFIVTGGY
jgi:hypothetical protein